MTDTIIPVPVPEEAKKGFSKAGLGGILTAAAPQIHPLLVTWLTTHYPIIGNTLAEVLVCNLELFAGGTVVYWTPHSIVQSIVDSVTFLRQSAGKIWAAATGKNKTQ